MAPQPKSVSDDLFAPDLWGRPSAAESFLQRLWVLGPYPTDYFFQRFQKEFDPKSVLLVADDGCRPEEAEKIRGLFPNSAFQVRYARRGGSGLLHAKIYLAEWRLPSPPWTVLRLVWGSPNASRNGFEVNAEAVSSVTINGAERESLLPYFEHLWRSHSGKVDSVDTLFPGGVRLLLPSFGFSSSPEPESFEGWIQSGLLCHKYEPDQSFPKLDVQLKEPPPRGRFQRLFADAGLRPATNMKAFRFPFLGDFRRPKSKKSPPWRAKYFLETWLGFWTSDACYSAHRAEFTAQNQQRRQEILTEVERSDEAKQSKWCGQFVDRLQLVVAGLIERELEPSRYFHTQQNKLDVAYCTAKACEQLRKHQAHARNSIFADRFTKGYVFPPVPRFRGAEAAQGGSFQEFIESLCETILTALTKRLRKNVLVRVLAGELRKLGIETDTMTGRDLREELQGNWDRIGQTVRGFYRQRPFHSEGREAMPVHDWTRVSDGTFHDFHYSWVLEIKRALKRGLLPKGYYVMAEQFGGDLGAPDVLTLQAAGTSPGPEGPLAGTATLTETPPAVHTRTTIARDSYARVQRTLVIRHTSEDRIVAMIEVLSPGNKSSRHAIRSFLDKTVAALDGGIHLLLVDVHPPGPRDPHGIHGAVLNEIGTEEYVLGSERLLTAVAYTGGALVDAFVAHFAVGEPIPQMPLFLTKENYVGVPLEAAYMAAWEDVPPQYQEVLLGSS